MKKIERERTQFKKEYIPLIFAVLFLIVLIVALVYVIFYKPEKKYTDELYSMETQEVSINLTNLACNNDVSQKIMNDANNVKVRYEENHNYYFGKTNELEEDLNGDGIIGEIDSYGDALKVFITGVTENIYLKIENDVDYDEPTYKFEDTNNGSIIWDQTENTYVRTYDVKVYSNNPECGDILFREFKFVLPRLNMLSINHVCEDNRDLEVCKTFVFEDDQRKFFDLYKEQIGKRVDEENNQKQEEIKKENKNKEILELINKYKIFIIIGGIIIVVGIVVIIMKRRK